MRIYFSLCRRTRESRNKQNDWCREIFNEATHLRDLLNLDSEKVLFEFYDFNAIKINAKMT